MAFDINELRKQFREKYNLPIQSTVEKLDVGDLRKRFKEAVLQPKKELEIRIETAQDEVMDKPIFRCYNCFQIIRSVQGRVFGTIVSYTSGLAICFACDGNTERVRKEKVCLEK